MMKSFFDIIMNGIMKEGQFYCPRCRMVEGARTFFPPQSEYYHRNLSCYLPAGGGFGGDSIQEI